MDITMNRNRNNTERSALNSLRFAAVLLLCLLLVCTLGGCSAGKKGKCTVRVVVDCGLALLDDDLSPEKRELLPEDGILLDVPMEVKEGESAEKIILRALKEKKMQFENEGGYFSGISNLYEGDCGEYSGWMFYVDAELSDVGAASYAVGENDVISLLYVTDYRPLFE